MDSLNLFHLGAYVEVSTVYEKVGIVEDVDYEDSTNVKYLVMWAPDDGEWFPSRMLSSVRLDVNGQPVVALHPELLAWLPTWRASRAVVAQVVHQQTPPPRTRITAEQMHRSFRIADLRDQEG